MARGKLAARQGAADKKNRTVSVVKPVAKAKGRKVGHSNVLIFRNIKV